MSEHSELSYNERLEEIVKLETELKGLRDLGDIRASVIKELQAENKILKERHPAQCCTEWKQARLDEISALKTSRDELLEVAKEYSVLLDTVTVQFPNVLDPCFNQTELTKTGHRVIDIIQKALKEKETKQGTNND